MKRLVYGAGVLGSYLADGLVQQAMTLRCLPEAAERRS